MAKGGEFAFDAVVIGGGPAGSIAARELAKAGARVAIVDKARFPRDKVCGDFVGPRGVKELERLGLGDTLTGEGVNPITRGSVYLDGALVLRKPLPHVEGLPPYGTMVPREIFDERLFRAACAAGAEPLEGHAFLSYEHESGAIVARVRAGKNEKELRGRVLIGADGSASLVGLRMRGAPQPRPDRINAVRAYFDGVAGPDDSVDLHFQRATFPGYLWIFPTGGGRANVGIGMAARTLPQQERHLRDLLNDALGVDDAVRTRMEHAELQDKIVGWPLCTYNGRLPVTGERIALAGDAAGFINPINGEGIQYAIESGAWLAEALAPALTGKRPLKRALTMYAERVAREIGLDMALNRLMIQLACNRALNPVWLELLGAWSARGDHDDEYLSVAASVVAGLLPTRRMFENKTRNVSLAVAAETLRTLPTSKAFDVLQAIVATTIKNPRAALGWAGDVAEAGLQVVREAAA